MLFRPRVKRLTIVNPCHESWSTMSGGDMQRFCDVCNRSVHDLSVLTRRQASDLLANNGGKVCGRISFDKRGNQIFAKDRRPIERLMQISVLGASAAVSAAAAPTCTVKVRVVDPSGAVVPKAGVNIRNTAGAEAVSSGTSSDQGEFSGRIAPGVYTLQVESPGFNSFQQPVTCKASETIAVDAPLRVGLLGEVVEVQSKPSPVWSKLRSLFRRL
jgi:hypothetical protein